MNYYNEFDKTAAAWLRELIRNRLIPEGDVDERSITEVRADELRGYTQCHFFAGIGGWSLALQLAQWPSTEPVWTGSCPCQPFSVAGKGRGTEDERHLWPVFRELIRACKPPTVFGEQVASEDGRQWLAGVFSDLDSMDYRRAGADLCAAGVGAPHIRQRIYWLANSNKPHEFVGKKAEREAESKWGVWEQFTPVKCADQRTRRCSPDAPLLAYGISFPMADVRAYGNAIVPQVAAEFIAAYLESV